MGHNHLHLFQTTIQAESAEGDKNAAPNDPIYGISYTDVKLQLFDFEAGEVAWERTFPFPTGFQQVDQTSIAVLTHDGILSLLDLNTGKVRFERKIDGLQDISSPVFSIRKMAQGYVCVVGTADGANPRVELDKNTVVVFAGVKKDGWLGRGYIFAVECETGKALWNKPVRVESFGVIDGTPYHSPFLLLARRATYRSSAGGAGVARMGKPRIQVAMLDVETGKLKSNHLIKAAGGSEPRCQIVCRPGKEYQTNEEHGRENDEQHQRLELLIAGQRHNIQLAESKEDDQVTAPVVLSNDTSVMKLEDDAKKFAEGESEGSNLVIDLKPMTQRAKEANDAMLELGKFEAELFEKQRKARQQR